MSTVDGKRELTDLWDARIAAYVASGLSIARWCKENDIPDHQLRYQLQKRNSHHDHSTTPDSSRWIALQMKPSSISLVLPHKKKATVVSPGAFFCRLKTCH
jgi:transposase-like protein